MHILAAHYRSEFLATPQLIRFDYADGFNGPEPTLLIKASTLLLKYIVQGVKMHLVFARLDDRLLYALKVVDDEKKPASVWSILEHDAEKAALLALAREEHCEVFLFNELAVNVAWKSLRTSGLVNLTEMISAAVTGPADHAALKNDASAVFDSIRTRSLSSSDLIIADLQNGGAWEPIRNEYITNQATNSPIDLFSSNEGGQQEQLAVWLTDSLLPFGVHHSPQVAKGSRFRELSDVLISYEFGSILIESKTLALLGRNPLPNRTKLAHDVSQHIKKAINQLRGGIRQLKNDALVKSNLGVPLHVEHTQPIHGIILIPELDLIEDRQACGVQLMDQFMKATGGLLHLLDIAELLRVVQAAEMIAARGTTTTTMMAFDYYLIERAKKAYDAGTLCIHVLLRFAED